MTIFSETSYLAFVGDDGTNIFDVGGLIFVGENSELSVRVEAVVGDVLSDTFALHSEEFHLNVRCSVFDLSNKKKQMKIIILR